MSPIEMKVNAIMRAMTSPDPETYESAMAEIRMYLESEQPRKNGSGLDIKEYIGDVLLELGVPNHLKGYPYLLTAINAVVETPDLINEITKGLYPVVAEIHNTTKSRAERAIRHAIEDAWDRIDLDTMLKYFGNTVSPTKGKPTNGEFISRVSNVIRRRLKN